LLNSNIVEERRAAANSYASNNMDSAGQVLISKIDDPDPEVRKRALVLIRNTNTRLHQEKIAECLDDPDPGVRVEAAVLYEGDEAAVQSLASVLDAERRRTRKFAVKRLANYDTPQANEALREALDDDNDEIRTLAEEALE
jgi:HEAT repeat protein